MFSPSTISAALFVVSGVLRIRREVDEIATERALTDSPLALPIPETDQLTPRDVLDIFEELRDDATLHADGSPVITADDRAALAAVIDDDTVQGPAILDLYYSRFAGKAILLDKIPPGDATFLDRIRERHPEWLKDPDMIGAAYYVRATPADRSERFQGDVWRATKVLLDLFADFGAAQVGHFVKDERLQSVLSAVMKNFGAREVDEGGLAPSQVLRAAFASTVNGVLDARESVGVDANWVGALLDSFGDLRDEMNDQGTGAFDRFVAGLFEGRGFSRLVTTVLGAAAGQIGTGEVMRREDAVRQVASSYLKRVAAMIGESETVGDVALEDFLRNRWGDLLRGAFLSIDGHAGLIIGDSPSPLLMKVLDGVLATLGAQSDQSFLEFYSGDVLATVVEATAGVVAGNPELLEDELGEPWFREVLMQAGSLVSSRGVRSALSAGALSDLAGELVRNSARAFIDNPGLLEDAIGEVWLRQLAPSIVAAVSDRDVLASLGERGMHDLVSAIGDAAVRAFATDPGLVDVGATDNWFEAMVAGAVALAARDGVASLLTPEGARDLLHASLRSGAGAVAANPDLLGVDDAWFRTLLVAVSESVVESDAGALLTGKGIASLSIASIDGALAAVADNPGLLAGSDAGDRLKAVLHSLLTAAAGSTVRTHFTKDGLAQLLERTVAGLARNSGALLSSDTPAIASTMFKSVLEAVGGAVSSKPNARDLADSVLRSALAVVAQGSEFGGRKYAEAVAIVAGSVSALVEAGKLRKPLAVSLLDLVPKVLAENLPFFAGKHRRLAGPILASVIAARDVALEEIGNAEQAAPIRLDTMLTQMAEAVLMGVASAAHQRLQALTVAAAEELIDGELVSLLALGFGRLTTRVGNGFSSNQIPVVVEIVVANWAAGALAGPDLDPDAFDERFAEILLAQST